MSNQSKFWLASKKFKELFSFFITKKVEFLIAVLNFTCRWQMFTDAKVTLPFQVQGISLDRLAHEPFEAPQIVNTVSHFQQSCGNNNGITPAHTVFPQLYNSLSESKTDIIARFKRPKET